MKNNKSPRPQDWTASHLKQEAKNYYHLIYELSCYGSNDLLLYDDILVELQKRGIDPHLSLSFSES